MTIERTRNVLRTSLGIRSRMRCWSGKRRIQDEISVTSDNATGPIATAAIAPAKWYCISVGSKVAITAENSLSIVGIGNDKDVGFVISRACLQPCLGFARIVGSSHVGVPNRASDLEAAEFVYQDYVEYTRDRVGSINSRSAILQNFDAIDHREWNQVDVHANAICIRRDAFSIHQDQGFLGQKAAKVGYDGAVTAIGDVLVDRSARLNRQFVEQIRLVNDTQLLNVFRAVGVHRIWAGLLRRRNIRAGDYNALSRGFTGACRCPRGRRCTAERRGLTKCICYEEK